MIEVQNRSRCMPGPYLSVGLDVGADFTWVAIAAPDGTPVEKPFKMIHNDPASREAALSLIKKAQDELSLKPLCFAESTGVYHRPVLCFFESNGLETRLINPIITKSSTNLNVRKVHNDRFDAQKIAQLGQNPTLKTSAVVPENIQALRSLVRDYYGYIEEREKHVLKLTALLKTSFPLYSRCFQSIASGTSLAVLDKWPTPADFLKAEKAEVMGVLHSAKRGAAWEESKYAALSEAANSALQFGAQTRTDAFRIRCCIQAIRAVDELAELHLHEMHKLVYIEPESDLAEYVNLIQSYRGAGFVISATLVAEMGDPHAFSSGRKLAAFWGLDPGVRQSGHYEAPSCRMSKRGSPYARRGLYMLALQSLRMYTVDGKKAAVHPELRAYYDELRKRKPAKVAIGAVMHKLAMIIYAVLRDGEPYRPLTAEEHAERMAQRQAQARLLQTARA